MKLNRYELNKNKVPDVQIDTRLDKFDEVILFPDKLEKANAQIRKSGFPTLTKVKK